MKYFVTFDVTQVLRVVKAAIGGCITFLLSILEIWV